MPPINEFKVSLVNSVLIAMTRNLLNYIDSSYVEKYKLDSECLYLLINNSSGPTVATETLKLTFDGSQWSLDGRVVEAVDLWNAVSEWQIVKYRYSLGRVSSSIRWEKYILDSQLKYFPSRPNGKRVSDYIAELQYHFSVCWVAIHKEKTAALKKLTSDFKKSSLAKMCETGNEWLLNQVRALDPGIFFVYATFFKQILDELVVQETIASIKRYFGSITKSITQAYNDHCANSFSYLELILPEIDRRTQKVMKLFSDECSKEIIEIPSRVTIDWSLFLDEFGHPECSRNALAAAMITCIKDDLLIDCFHGKLITKIRAFPEHDISEEIFAKHESLKRFVKSSDASLADEQIVRERLKLIENATEHIYKLQEQLFAFQSRANDVD